MPNYPGRRKGTRRVVISVKNQQIERVVEGSKRDADAYEARLRLELEADQLSTRTAPTFADFSTLQYTPHAKLSLKASTWKQSRKYQLTNLIEFFGQARVSEITTTLTESYKEQCLREGMAPGTINNDLHALLNVLRWAKKTGYPALVPDVVFLTVRGSPRVRFWTRPEAYRLLEAARQHGAPALGLCVFLLNTGCRRGESIAAEWDWMDFDGGMVRIPSNEAWQPKSGKPREIPMADAVRAALGGPRANERWVFPSTKGDRFRGFPIWLFNEVRDAAGLRGGAHTTRHTFAAHFLAREPDLYLLSQILGHSHQRTTELYAHLLPEHLARGRNVVNIGPAMAAVKKPGGTAG